MREKMKHVLLLLFFCICAGSFDFIFSLTFPVYERSSELSINQVENPSFEYKTVQDGSSGNLPLYWTKAYSSATITIQLYLKRWIIRSRAVPMKNCILCLSRLSSTIAPFIWNSKTIIFGFILSGLIPPILYGSDADAL